MCKQILMNDPLTPEVVDRVTAWIGLGCIALFAIAYVLSLFGVIFD